MIENCLKYMHQTDIIEIRSYFQRRRISKQCFKRQVCEFFFVMEYDVGMDFSKEQIHVSCFIFSKYKIKSPPNCFFWPFQIHTGSNKLCLDLNLDLVTVGLWNPSNDISEEQLTLESNNTSFDSIIVLNSSHSCSPRI